jgi:hypothetical protein
MRKVDAAKSPARLFDVLMLTDLANDAIEFLWRGRDDGTTNKKM